MSDPPAPASLEAMFARLTDRQLSIAQIARLTWRQIADIYGHQRDETGQVQEPVAMPEPSYQGEGKEADREALFGAGRALGVPEEELRRVWLARYPEDEGKV